MAAPFQDIAFGQWLAVANIIAIPCLALFYILTAFAGGGAACKKLLAHSLYFLVFSRSIYLGCLDLGIFMIGGLTAALVSLQLMCMPGTRLQKNTGVFFWGVACCSFFVLMTVPWGSFESGVFSNEFSRYFYWRGASILKKMWEIDSIAIGDIWVGAILAVSLFIAGVWHGQLRRIKRWILLAAMFASIVFIFHWFFAGHLNIRVQIQQKRNVIIKYCFFWRPSLVKVTFWGPLFIPTVDLQMEVPQTREVPILTAIRVGNIELVREFLLKNKKRRAEIFHFREFPSWGVESTATDWAIFYGEPEIMDLLLKEGILPHNKDRALKRAAFSQTPGVLALLLQRGYPPDGFTGSSERPPVVTATAFGSLETLQVLIEYGADLNRDSHIGSPLIIAARRCDQVRVKLLLSSGAIPHSVSGGSESTTALHVAATQGNVPIVRMLLEAGADAGSLDHSGRKPLDYAREGKHSEVIRFLEEQDTSPSDQNGTGEPQIDSQPE